MGVSAPVVRRAVAAEWLLLSPAALFMTALVVRRLRPLSHEPAYTAQRIVTWFSVQPWTLWVLLIALPFAVLISGVLGLMGGWTFGVAPERARRPMRGAIRADPGTAIHRGCDVDRRSHPGDCRRA